MIIYCSEKASNEVISDVLHFKIGSLFREYYEMSHCDGPTSYLTALSGSRTYPRTLATAQSTVALLSTYLFSLLYEARQNAEGDQVSLGKVPENLAVEVAMKLTELGYPDQVRSYCNYSH